MTRELLAIAGTVGLLDGSGGLGPRPDVGSGGCCSQRCALARGLTQPRSQPVLAFRSQMRELTPGLRPMTDSDAKTEVFETLDNVFQPALGMRWTCNHCVLHLNQQHGQEGSGMLSA